MSYPSVAVKGAAMRLLQAVERAPRLVGPTLHGEMKIGSEGETFVGRGQGNWGEQHLSFATCRLLRSMLSEVWNTVCLSLCEVGLQSDHVKLCANVLFHLNTSRKNNCTKGAKTNLMGEEQ